MIDLVIGLLILYLVYVLYVVINEKLSNKKK